MHADFTRHVACPFRRVLRRALSVSVVLAAAALCGSANVSYGQTASASDVKAGFIYNFARFTTWPIEARDGDKPPLICVMGDDTVANALQQAPNGALGPGVRVVKSTDALTGCRVLYLSGLDAKDTQRVLTAVCSRPVFTVSDTPSFATLGGIAELVNDSGRLRFAINVDAARRANLTLSAKMLSLARIVKEERHVQP